MTAYQLWQRLWPCKEPWVKSYVWVGHLFDVTLDLHRHNFITLRAEFFSFGFLVSVRVFVGFTLFVYRHLDETPVINRIHEEHKIVEEIVAQALSRRKSS